MAELRIYDNGGLTIDRYMVIIGDDVYGMSADALSPGGFNNFCGNLNEFELSIPSLGEDVTDDYATLPDGLVRAILFRAGQ